MAYQICEVLNVGVMPVDPSAEGERVRMSGLILEAARDEKNVLIEVAPPSGSSGKVQVRVNNGSMMKLGHISDFIKAAF